MYKKSTKPNLQNCFVLNQVINTKIIFTDFEIFYHGNAKFEVRVCYQVETYAQVSFRVNIYRKGLFFIIYLNPKFNILTKAGVVFKIAKIGNGIRLAIPKRPDVQNLKPVYFLVDLQALSKLTKDI